MQPDQTREGVAATARVRRACPECGWFDCPPGHCLFREVVQNPERSVVSFTLPSNGERWNWPCPDGFAQAAFVEVLDRANIPWSVSDATA